MEKPKKQQMKLIAFGVVLFAALMNLGAVIAVAGRVVEILAPVAAGFIVAFIFNVPMKGFEKLFHKLTGKMKKPPREKLIQLVSLLLTLICVLLVVTLVCTMLIPELVASAQSIYRLVLKKWPTWASALEAYDINTAQIGEWVSSLDLQQLLGKIANSAGTLISSAVNVASVTASSLASVAASAVIAIYVLLSKNDLARQSRKLAYAYLKKPVADYSYRVAKLLSETYSRFLSGQCVEACILGVLMFLTFMVFGFPYADLTAVLTAVFAFVPYVGSFLACATGALLILLAEPGRVLLFIVVYITVQFIENQFIYPRVVGASVELSPLWTLVAVFIGGKLLGLLGMIFFIPLTAVLVTLLREHTNQRIQKKNGLQTPKSTSAETE